MQAVLLVLAKLSVMLWSLSCATAAKKSVTAALPQPVQARIDANELHASHYVGIFQNDRLKKSFPAVLDLVVKHGKEKRWRLQGVLRVYAMGDDNHYRVFSSYYDSIKINDHQITFDVNEQKIRPIANGKWHQEKITTFVVVYGFGQGKLELHKQARTDFSLPPAPASRPLALPVLKLQRTAFPQRVFANQATIKAETGLLSTSKNLLQRDLFDVNYESIDRFGVYYGVLHHEQLNTFQYVRLAFVNDKEAGTTRAISTLFFSEPQHREFIVYRYQVARQVMHGKLPLLVGDGTEGEAFMLLHRWDKHGIGGVWYSKVHGRIGTVFFMRARFPRLAAGARLVPALRGQRQGRRYHFDLQVDNSVARYGVVFPKQLGGTFSDILQQKNHQVTGGSYDFYRGTVELSYEGGLLRYSVYDQQATLAAP